jgi:hypothetical protein
MLAFTLALSEGQGLVSEHTEKPVKVKDTFGRLLWVMKNPEMEYVHLYSIQVTEFIVRYQINHSPYDNEIGDSGNIVIVACCLINKNQRICENLPHSTVSRELPGPCQANNPSPSLGTSLRLS